MRETDRQSKLQNVRLGVDVARDFVQEIKRKIFELHGSEQTVSSTAMQKDRELEF